MKDNEGMLAKHPLNVAEETFNFMREKILEEFRCMMGDQNNKDLYDYHINNFINLIFVSLGFLNNQFMIMMDEIFYKHFKKDISLKKMKSIINDVYIDCDKYIINKRNERNKLKN